MKLHLGSRRSVRLVGASVGTELLNFDFQTMITNVRYDITGLDRLLGLQEVENRKICRQSAREGGNVVSPTRRPPLPPRTYPWYSFMLEALSIPGHSAAGRIMSMKNTNYIGNRACDFPAFSAVPQPDAPTRDPIIVTSFILF